jgi:methionine biosynthesis protein MetW
MSGSREDEYVSKYYNDAWATKLQRKEYRTLDARWRSRWEFAVQEIPQKSKVLDCGCGDGILGGMLKNKGCDVYGLDISEYAMALATERGVKTASCDLSSDSFPFQDGFFDAVVFACVLEHIAFPEHALREAARVAKDEGIVIVTIPNAVNIRFRLGFLRGRVPIDFLHLRPGEGVHLRFFDFKQDFDRLVSSVVPELKIVKKVATIKNPKSHNVVSRWLLSGLMRLLPNLFCEYTNIRLVKAVGNARISSRELLFLKL